MWDEFFERLKVALDVANQAELAKKLKKSRNAVTDLKKRMEAGEPLSEKWVLELRHNHGLNPDWLRDGSGPMHLDRRPVVLEEEEQNGDFVYVEKAEARPRGGTGGLETSGKRLNKYAFQRKWIFDKVRSPDKVVIFEVRGHSMAPLIDEGDHILVNTSDTVIMPDALESNRIYVIRIEDEFAVKRLIKRPGAYLFRSENRACDDEDITIDMRDESVNWQVAGRVFWVCRELE